MTDARRNRHGTWTNYANGGCRCARCRQANTAKHREWRHRTGFSRPMEVVIAERQATAEARDNHGTETRYQLGCRCDKCREGSRVARAARRARVSCR